MIKNMTFSDLVVRLRLKIVHENEIKPFNRKICRLHVNFFSVEESVGQLVSWSVR